MNKNFGITDMSNYARCSNSFWVRIGWVDIDGKNKPWFSKTFLWINKNGGKHLALTKSRKWRDKKYQEWNEIQKTLGLGKKIPYYTGIQSNNKTGINGVYITDYYTLSDKWTCHYRQAIGTITINGKRYECNRSCKKYGDDEAVKMCGEWRKDMELRFKS